MRDLERVIIAVIFAGIGFVISLAVTDATGVFDRSGSVLEAIKECEHNLPRDQYCAPVYGARIAEKEE